MNLVEQGSVCLLSVVFLTLCAFLGVSFLGSAGGFLGTLIGGFILLAVWIWIDG